MISFVLVIVTLAAITIVSPVVSAQRYGDYEYTVTDGKATITKYHGSDVDVVIPASLDGVPVTNIDLESFKDQSRIKSVKIPEGVTEISEYVPMSGKYSGAFEGCTHLEKVELPDSLEIIGYKAFSGCKYLSEVTIPGNVTDIKEQAFYGCQHLRSIEIPGSVKTIGFWAFKDCTRLEQLTLNDGLILLDGASFWGCTSLTSVEIPDSVTKISSAFGNCSSLESINIPDGVTFLGEVVFNTPIEKDESRYEDGALYIGKHLIKVNGSVSGDYAVKDGTRCIASSAFSNCGRIGKLTIPDTAIICQGAFEFGYITEVDIAEGVSIIGGSAFYYCNELTRASIPGSTVILGDGAFSDCSVLKEVTIGEGLTKIGNEAFLNCNDLETITIPSSVREIGDSAFSADDDYGTIYGVPKITVYYNGTAYDWKTKVNVSYEKNEWLQVAKYVYLVKDAAEAFRDVKHGKWYSDGLNYVYTEGIMNGVSDDKFAPNEAMTRAMLVTVLWRAEGSPATGTKTPFTDLKAKWYKTAVAWAYENGIVDGMEDGIFAPDGKLTREQISTIMFRYAEYKKGDTSARTDLSGYKDASKIHSYAKDAVSWAVASGLIKGVKADELDPRGNATRAQVATILLRQA